MVTPSHPLAALATEVSTCRRCPRLVEWRERVARTKRAAFAAEEYWGRPVPGFGDPAAWLLVVGLAPGAHGSNRTGRMFTGDRSGDLLYQALHRAGLASQPESVSRHDGLRLQGTWITAAVRCAPPGNRPTPAERDACRPFLEREWDLLPNLRVVVALGGLRVLGGATLPARPGRDAPSSPSALRPRGGNSHPSRSLGARLIPSFPAEHLHRQADPGDVRHGLAKSTRAPRNGLRQTGPAGAAVSEPGCRPCIGVCSRRGYSSARRPLRPGRRAVRRGQGRRDGCLPGPRSPTISQETPPRRAQEDRNGVRHDLASGPQPDFAPRPQPVRANHAPRPVVGGAAGGVSRLQHVHRLHHLGGLPGRVLHLRQLPLSLLLARAVRRLPPRVAGTPPRLVGASPGSAGCRGRPPT